MTRLKYGQTEWHQSYQVPFFLRVGVLPSLFYLVAVELAVSEPKRKVSLVALILTEDTSESMLLYFHNMNVLEEGNFVLYPILGGASKSSLMIQENIFSIFMAWNL